MGREKGTQWNGFSNKEEDETPFTGGAAVESRIHSLKRSIKHVRGGGGKDPVVEDGGREARIACINIWKKYKKGGIQNFEANQHAPKETKTPEEDYYDLNEEVHQTGGVWGTKRSEE